MIRNDAIDDAADLAKLALAYGERFRSAPLGSALHLISCDRGDFLHRGGL